MVCMRKIIGTVLLASVLLMSPGSQAEETKKPTTVQEYVSAFDPSSRWYEYISGVIRGLHYVMSLNGAVGVHDVPKVCYTENVSTGQMWKVFLNWAKANPKHWKKKGVTAVMVALEETWPC